MDEVLQKYEEEVENASPLMYAVAASCPLCALLLIRNGADVDAATHTGVTALMLAAVTDQRAVVNMLLANGASVDDQAEDAADVLFPGARGDAAAAVRKELPSGLTEGASALWLAAYAGKAEIVDLLLKAGAADNMEASFEDGPDSQKDPVSCTAEGVAELRRHKRVIEAFDKAYARGKIYSGE